MSVALTLPAIRRSCRSFQVASNCASETQNREQASERQGRRRGEEETFRAGCVAVAFELFAAPNIYPGIIELGI